MPLVLGPVVGAVTDTTARIWIQADDAEPYLLRLFADASGPAEVPGSPFRLVPDPAAGGTLVVEAGGLRPDAVHGYRIEAPDGSPAVPASRAGLSFRTFPAPGTAADFVFGFFSCHRPSAYGGRPEAFALWRRMEKVLAREGARLLLAVGDQVYADDWYEEAIRRPGLTPEELKEGYRRVYRAHWRSEEVQRVLGRWPTFMIWDDHEVTDGWGSDRKHAGPRARAIFEAARAVYREFQHSHNPPAAAPGALHYSFAFGDTGVFVFDLRGSRDVNRKKRPLLGGDQIRDFRAWLRASAGCRVRFVVTSVPLIHAPAFLAKAGGKVLLDLADQWSAPRFRDEQEIVVRLLLDEANRSDGKIVVLGGDVHVGTTAVIRSRLKEYAHRPLLYQFTSSPISNAPSALANLLMAAAGREVDIQKGEIAGRLLQVFKKRNFGLVRVSRHPASGAPSVSFEVHEEGAKEPAVFSAGA